MERTELLYGAEAVKRLAAARVLVVGIGGVGGYAAELLVRAGIGRMFIADGDRVDVTNINRQTIALTSTVGKPKVEIMAAKLRDINPEIKLETCSEFIKDEKTGEILQNGFDFVVDAIDVLSHKVSLIAACLNADIKLVSSMGAGAKTDPGAVKLADISKSFNCRLAKMVRKRLHKRGIYSGFKVVFSEEMADAEAVCLDKNTKEGEAGTLTTAGTVSYMPAIFGCHCAAEVVGEITGDR